ncbi:MAG: PAS domain S-box protein, partial [Phycisphaerales bacterium]|nr:PAS domain S-box protein [Phycisphaerales bacterium]
MSPSESIQPRSGGDAPVSPSFGVVDALPDPVVRLRRDGRIISINPAWTERLGHAARALDRVDLLTLLTVSADAVAVDAALARAGAGETSVVEVAGLRGDDGATCSWEITFLPSDDEIVGILRDRTSIDLLDAEREACRRLVGAAPGDPAAWRAVARAVAEPFGFRDVLIERWDPSTDERIVLAGCGTGGAGPWTRRGPVSSSWAAEVVRDGRVCIASATSGVGARSRAMYDAGTTIAAPIRAGGRIVGVLTAVTGSRMRRVSVLDAVMRRVGVAVGGLFVAPDGVVAPDATDSLRALVDHIDDVFWLFDRDEGGSLFVSPALGRLFGRPSANGVDREACPLRPFVVPEDLATLDESIAVALDGREADVTIRVRATEDGGCRWVRIRMFPVFASDGVVGRLAGIAKDVSARHRREAALRARGDQLAEQNRILVRLATNPGLFDGDGTYGIGQVVEAATVMLGAGIVALWQGDPSSSRLVRFDPGEASAARPDGLAAEVSLDAIGDLVERFAEVRVLSTVDATGDPRTAAFARASGDPARSVSMLLAPIRGVDGAPLGLLHVEQSGLRRWRADEQTFMASLADVASAILRAGRANRDAASAAAHRHRLHVVLECMPMVLWSTDVDLRFTSSHGLGLAALGTEPGAAVGMTLAEYFGTDDPTFLPIAAARRALGGASETYDITWGGRVYQSHVQPLRDDSGVITGTIGIAMDVTEGHLAAATADAEQMRMAMLLQHLPNLVVYETSPEREFVSETIENLLGYTSAELKHDRQLFWTVLHPDDRAGAEARLREWEARGRVGPLRLQARLRRRDGRYIWIEDRMFWLQPPDRPPYLAGVMLDITDQKITELALRDSRSALRELHALAARSDRSLDERIHDVLAIGCDHFDMSIGLLTRLDGEDLVATAAIDRGGFGFEVGAALPCAHTYCASTLDSGRPVSFDIARDTPWANFPCYPSFQWECYIGCPVYVDGRVYGTVCFGRREPREWPFQSVDHELIQLMARWIGGEIERQASADSLSRSREQYRGLFEQASDGIFIIDASGRIADVNAAGCQLLRLPYAEALGQRVDDVFPAWQRVDEVAADAEPRLREMPFRCGDGREIPVEVSAKRSLNGSCQAIVRDITERHRAERALRENEGRLRGMFENSGIGIALVDGDGRIQQANRALGEMLGAEADALAGRPFSELLHPDDVPTFTSSFGTLFSNGRSAALEVRYRTTSGQTLWGRTTMNLAPAGDGPRRFGVAMIENISKRKQTEAELYERTQLERLLFRELDHRVRNNLASLESLITIGVRSATDVGAFAESIRRRIGAMANVHAMLSHAHWRSLRLHEMLRTLAAAETVGRVELEGEDVLVPPRQATALAMVMHELLINSLKYGALGASDGVTRVEWSLDRTASDATTIRLRWTERGAPPIVG